MTGGWWVLMEDELVQYKEGPCAGDEESIGICICREATAGLIRFTTLEF